MAGNCTEKERGEKLHFQGSRPRARQIMERIAQDAMLETEMEEGKLSVVVCAGWSTLSQTVICYQELQCLKKHFQNAQQWLSSCRCRLLSAGCPCWASLSCGSMEKPPKPCSGCLGGAWSTCVVDVGRWSCCENQGGYENFLNSPIWLTQQFANLTDSLTHWLADSLTHSLTHARTHALTHSLLASPSFLHSLAPSFPSSLPLTSPHSLVLLPLSLPHSSSLILTSPALWMLKYVRIDIG